MRFTTAIALLAGVVAAQTTTGPASPASTECPALNVVENCLSGAQARVSACPANDWACLCAAQDVVVQCYINCPNDSRASSANSVKIQYCQAAQQANPSSSSSAASRASTTVVAGTSTASRASSSTAAAKSGAAGAIGASGNGLLAVAVGIAALI